MTYDKTEGPSYGLWEWKENWEHKVWAYAMLWDQTVGSLRRILEWYHDWVENIDYMIWWEMIIVFGYIKKN